ncbi:hypothetical protein [Allomuricauda sp. SCSIO 65647]|uniref:hypothetical protein n=1 Tax=Allomuricauda sp. SCSIO 65647 TaxID=2908843 RepID=UPI001F2807C1|nr:hypothetical protein [Muricauda sp. SCSIO 65647]UJH67173.1 hypothetical protein L0P89_14625 [Muricauda sp. SCSIO 65647]
MKPAGKSTAIISYITLVGALIAISMNAEPKHAFARFHARQAFGIHLIFHALAIVLTYSFSGYSWLILYVVYITALVFGLTAALGNKETTLPLLGKHFQNWFTFIP